MTHVDRLTLERTACFGRCPEYTVAVSGDGLVAFEGRRFVPVSGSFSWRVSPYKVRELVHALNAAAFLSLANRYERREDGCPSVWTDLPTVTIVLQQDGLQKVVRHDHGCRGTPDPPLRWPQKSLPPPPPPPWGPFQPTWDQDFPFPYSLTALEDRIDEILGTAAWVGGRQSHIPPSALGRGRQ